jgi:hypothetical protein
MVRPYNRERRLPRRIAGFYDVAGLSGSGGRMTDLQGLTLAVSDVGQGLGRRSTLAAALEGDNVVLGARTEALLASVTGDVDAAGGGRA